MAKSKEQIKQEEIKHQEEEVNAPTDNIDPVELDAKAESKAEADKVQDEQSVTNEDKDRPNTREAAADLQEEAGEIRERASTVPPNLNAPAATQVPAVPEHLSVEANKVTAELPGNKFYQDARPLEGLARDVESEIKLQLGARPELSSVRLTVEVFPDANDTAS